MNQDHSILYFNQTSKTSDGILSNAKIRKAIGLSIDRDVYTDELVGRYQICLWNSSNSY